MQCLDDQYNRGSKMQTIKYVVIFLLGALSVLLYMHFTSGDNPAAPIVDRAVCPDIRIRDMVSCPPPVTCPSPRVVEKIVYIEKKLGPGCHVNWKTKKVEAKTVQGYSLDCLVDWKNKKVDEVLYRSDMLRTWNPRPEYGQP